MAGKGKPCGASFIAADKQCKVGLSVQLNAKALKNADIGKLREWAGKAPFKYQRDKIEAEIAKRQGDAGIIKVPSGKTNRELAAEKKKLDDEQQKLQKELDRLVAIRDAQAKGKPSQKINAGFLKQATTQKLEEYMLRAPYQYQREAIKAELDRRKEGGAAKVVANKTDDLNKVFARLQNEKVRALNANDFDKAKRLADAQHKIQAELDKRKAGGPREAVALDKISRVPAPPPKKEPGVNRPFASKNDEQLKGKMEAAWALGKDADYRAMRAEYQRRIANDETKKRILGIDEDIRRAKEARQQYVKEGNADRVKKVDAMIKAMEGEKLRVGNSAVPQGMGKYEKERLQNIDKRVEANMTKKLGDGYDWRDSVSNADSKVLGAGAYGTAVRDSAKNVVKRGAIGENEGDILKRVGELDLGPKLIAAELNGRGPMSGTNAGRVAMTLVPGSPIGSKKGLEESYWQARAALHRAGIAHNDMHIENVMVDRQKKGRFVDMGLAQDNPKAALAEAMGMFDRVPNGAVRNGGEGDWQVKRWKNIGGKAIRTLEYGKNARESELAEAQRDFPTVARVVQNKEAAITKLKSYGLTDQDVANVMTHGIRKSEASFERGSMAKLTNEQALSVINTLYQGI